MTGGAAVVDVVVDAEVVELVGPGSEVVGAAVVAVEVDVAAGARVVGVVGGAG